MKDAAVIIGRVQAATTKSMGVWEREFTLVGMFNLGIQRTYPETRQKNPVETSTQVGRYLHPAPPPPRPWLVFHVSIFDGLPVSGIRPVSESRV